jgi:hypothetical protein
MQLCVMRAQEVWIRMTSRGVLFGAVAIAAMFLVRPCRAQQPQQPGTFPGTKQVLGLEGVKHNATGILTVQKGTLEFTSGKKKTDVPASSISDVVTDKDSQRAIGGVVGTISMFGPYGSGRFLSLFRTKIDTVTINYRDSSGALHGAVFTMPTGKAEEVKQDLLAEGAHTTIPTAPDATAPPAAAK